MVFNISSPEGLLFTFISIYYFYKNSILLLSLSYNNGVALSIKIKKATWIKGCLNLFIQRLMRQVTAS